MALFVCKVGGSEGLSKTTLWTNPSPTSDFPFNSGLDLSDDVSNYTFIEFVFKRDKAATTDALRSVIYKGNEVSNTSAQTSNMWRCISEHRTGSDVKERAFGLDNTQRHISFYPKTTSGTMIPYEINGYK